MRWNSRTRPNRGLEGRAVLAFKIGVLSRGGDVLQAGRLVSLSALLPRTELRGADDARQAAGAVLLLRTLVIETFLVSSLGFQTAARSSERS